MASPVKTPGEMESEACNQRLAAITALNKSLEGRYKLGDTVRVLSESSSYYLVEGTVVDISRFNDHGLISFTRESMSRSREPWRLERSKGLCHFYWRELQEIIYT